MRAYLLMAALLAGVFLAPSAAAHEDGDKYLVKVDRTVPLFVYGKNVRVENDNACSRNESRTGENESGGYSHHMHSWRFQLATRVTMYDTPISPECCWLPWIDYREENDMEGLAWEGSDLSDGRGKGSRAVHIYHYATVGTYRESDYRENTHECSARSSLLGNLRVPIPCV